MHRELSGMMSFCDLLMNFISAFKSSCQTYTTSFLHNILSNLKEPQSKFSVSTLTENTINKDEFGFVGELRWS